MTWNKHLAEAERKMINAKIDKEVNAMEGTYEQKAARRKFMQNIVDGTSVYALYQMGWLNKDKEPDFDYDIEINIPVTLRIGDEPEKKLVIKSDAITDSTLSMLFKDIDNYIINTVMRNR